MPSSGQLYVIPAPTGGINRKDNITDMPETDALDLINWIPEATDVRLRRGCRVASNVAAAKTLAEFAAPNGTRKLIAGAGGKLYDATVLTPVILGSGYASDYWQVTHYADALLLYNGVDVPKKITAPAGTTTLADLTYTADTGVTGLTATSLIQACPFKDILYFVHKDSSDLFYGVVGEQQGALKKLPLGRVLTKGGSLLFVSAWTSYANQQTDELLVIASDQGEILVYAGLNPSDDSWGKVGHFFISKPLGRRAFVRTGADLAVITTQEIVPLSERYQSAGGTNYLAISDKIQLLFSELSKIYGNRAGWEGTLYTEGHLLFVNVPISTVRSDQLVMNTLTGAWTRFRGWNAYCFCQFNSGLYYGGPNYIYQADYGLSDNGAAIESYIRPAYSYFKKPLQNKRLVLAKPHLTASTNVELAMSCDVDFESSGEPEKVGVDGVSGETWDVADWDVASWADDSIATADWVGIEGFGRAIAIKYAANFKDVEVTLSATNVLFELGGIF